MSSHAALDAAAQSRKEKLAKLKSLKRKQPDSTTEDAGDDSAAQQQPTEKSEVPDVTSLYLSGRNFDAATREPKLGYEANPASDAVTLEQQAKALAERTKAEAEAQEAADKPLDLFKLQPKKPNWDLKRDLERKMEVVNVRTENAIARLVRERIETAQKAAREKNGGSGKAGEDGDGEAVGMDGSAFVEAMHQREREEEADERREQELTAEEMA
ncbi:hypothetical protein K490DRAFT_45138 [Saccharata proteae CBS 121410]|uniref:Cwf18 pre-mRNA splicing factor n=1 Tax=Saccharata proteae CBS 121410 TaxID=1314787 RepID=A0A9P4LVN1_9PEZI|nr:hypothetical protein K490DRAFT_45138 [Saccharata proteae CBS 121410]